jgi:Fe-S-cluster-containing hydrogenase component 2
VCPTGALSIRRPEMEVVFDQKKCSVCELCVPACPPRAMEARPIKNSYFE